MTEMVDHPTHYKSADGSEVIDVIANATQYMNGIEAWDTGNMIKYICRWKWKNGIQDVQKCRWYARHLMNNRRLFCYSMKSCCIEPEYAEFVKATAKSFTADLHNEEYRFTRDILTSVLMWPTNGDKHLTDIIRACDELIKHLRNKDISMLEKDIKKAERKMN